MKLQFNPESKVTEWINGPLHFKDGDDIDVNPAHGRQMLKAVHEVSPNQFVNVFTLAEPKKATKADASEAAATFPNEFPSAEHFSRAGLSFDAVRGLSREDLLKIDGVGPKSADAVLKALKEQNTNVDTQ